LEISVRNDNGIPYALVTANELIIRDAQTALDLMVTVGYDADINLIAIYKEAVAEPFFVLSSGLAGDVLQKFVNYQVRLAIIGDFSGYTSKPLRDFMYESNRGSHVFFVGTEAEAAEKLTAN
jgi:hypothetical protein